MQKKILFFFVSVMLGNFKVFNGMENALAILRKNQSSCSMGPGLSFIFDDENSSKTIADSIKENPQTIDKILENLKEIQTKALSFKIDVTLKESFNDLCVSIENACQLAKIRNEKSRKVSDEEAKIIGKFSYKLSSIYGSLKFLDLPNKKIIFEN